MASKIEKEGRRIEIEVSKGGPYIVSGKVPMSDQIIIVNEEGVPVEWRTGKNYPSTEKCSLCRCGQSKSKPFCDNSHLKVGFDGTEAASWQPHLELAKVIDGASLKLTDVEDLCASARFCHRAGEIWNLIPKSGDAGARQAAIEEAGDCPSGRLVVWDKVTGKQIEPVFEKSLGMIEDPQVGCQGPIWVRGGIPVKSASGRVYEVRNRVTLCRCGKSTIKPFCDSSHFPEHKYRELMMARKQNLP
ncbi:MAG: CDGSH iron-sulfur domain-containing protein [Candidatus Bathyarchaeia archaeon]